MEWGDFWDDKNIWKGEMLGAQPSVAIRLG